MIKRLSSLARRHAHVAPRHAHVARSRYRGDQARALRQVVNDQAPEDGGGHARAASARSARADETAAPFAPLAAAAPPPAASPPATERSVTSRVAASGQPAMFARVLPHEEGGEGGEEGGMA